MVYLGLKKTPHIHPSIHPPTFSSISCIWVSFAPFLNQTGIKCSSPVTGTFLPSCSLLLSDPLLNLDQCSQEGINKVTPMHDQAHHCASLCTENVRQVNSFRRIWCKVQQDFCLGFLIPDLTNISFHVLGFCHIPIELKMLSPMRNMKTETSS